MGATGAMGGDYGTNTTGHGTGAGYGTGTAGYGTGTAGYGTGTTGMTGTSNTAAGPHSSNLANKMDPRVDSDLDGSRNMGATGMGTGTTAGTTGYGHTGNTSTMGSGNYNDPRSTNAGPHSSNMANKMDPRVDSDRDASRNMGATSYGTGPTGTTGHTGTTGTTHATGHHHAPGPAANTAGPHKSDMLNKLDPRVDSDLDGSRTAGGNQTYNA
jgi:hypothetical protein